MKTFLLLVVLIAVATAKDSDCGKANTAGAGNWRVTKGKNANKGAWPWMVSLDYPAGGHHCGGTLIRPRWVLTAAHCITRGLYDPREIHLRLGKHKLDKQEDSQIDMVAEAIFGHPEYSHGVNTAPHDIALVKLPSAVNYTDLIRPICLPEQEGEIERPTSCVVAGWGSTQSDQDQNTLQVVHGPALTKTESQSEDKRCGVYWQRYFTKDHICFGGEGSLTGACSGDSGGPLFCRNADGRYMQHGVVTFGFARYCNAPGFESLFTRVSGYREWIDKTIAEN